MHSRTKQTTEVKFFILQMLGKITTTTTTMSVIPESQISSVLKNVAVPQAPTVILILIVAFVNREKERTGSVHKDFKSNLTCTKSTFAKFYSLYSNLIYSDLLSGLHRHVNS